MSVLARLLQRADDEPIVIEEMRRRHLAAMLPIERDAYPKPWSRSVFESELEQVRSGNRHYIVARRRRLVIGYAGLWVSPDPAGDQGHITNIAVAVTRLTKRMQTPPETIDRGNPYTSSAAAGSIRKSLQIKLLVADLLSFALCSGRAKDGNRALTFKIARHARAGPNTRR